MIGKRTLNKRTLFIRKIVLVCLFLTVAFFLPIKYNSHLVTSTTKTEAYNAITEAFVKIEEASREGLAQG